MERKKLTKEDINKVHNIEGFPIGADEDIIALSDAPYYTACPNPFIKDFINENGTPFDEERDDYHREPFASDVSEGKNDPIYMAHSYHTKVPHKAIMRYILHYTNPGDVILDGFCGTGMTGVAAQMCDYNLAIKDGFVAGPQLTNAKWGRRYAVLSDLSPIASFIAHVYNSANDIRDLKKSLNSILSKAEEELSWLYKTSHCDKEDSLLSEDKLGTINYIVWSDVMICPHCGKEFVYWDVAVDENITKISDSFVCPECRMKLKKMDCKRAISKKWDDVVGETVETNKQVPVLINYTYNGKRYEKTPTKDDIELLNIIENFTIEDWYPHNKLIDGDKMTDPKNAGISYVHQFWTKRNLMCMAKLYALAKTDAEKFVITAIVQNSTRMYKFRTDRKGGIVTGTLFIPSLNQENNVFNLFRGKINAVLKGLSSVKFDNLVSLNSSTELPVPDSSIDYIFTDPPFGYNINYSELSFLWESWLNVFTNNSCEAIMSKFQGKGLLEYQHLMQQCFSEFNRVLKPNRWITIEFHNSKNSVWNAIQEAIARAGFVIADVRTIDKKQGSFNQVKGATQAIKQDLVISAYKPRDSFKHDFFLHAGTEESAWAFVRLHLANLPVVVLRNGEIEIVDERQAYLLYDRMVAYHIMQGIPVPLDATDFYSGLDEKFMKRDNMYFLPDQVNEYDTARITSDIEPTQFEMFVTNEKSAISWLYQQLGDDFGGPKTYAQLQTMFMQEVKAVDKFEAMPELSVILEENFLKNEDGQWYIPDVNKERDVTKLREKNLWKEFEGYLKSKGKLKLFRSEAIRVGFSRLWKEKKYQVIVDIAERLPEKTIQEDANLLMYYDISLNRI